MRVLRSVLISVVALMAAVVSPVAANAQTMSVTQIITVIARVAPTRSIVVNEQGRMTKIYSNTNEMVQPKVYLNDVPGAPRELTPELLAQYNRVIAQQKNLVGVEIPVEPPRADNNTVRNLLMNSISTLTSRLKL